MVVASCLALLAQFGPFPLPEHRTTIASLVVIFFSIMGCVGGIALFVDRDYIYFSLPKAKGVAKGKSIKVRTEMKPLEPE